jgi:hypothetical protein
MLLIFATNQNANKKIRFNLECNSKLVVTTMDEIPAHTHKGVAVPGRDIAAIAEAPVALGDGCGPEDPRTTWAEALEGWFA